MGSKSSLEDALKVFTASDLIKDLYYYYNDVVDIRFGKFIPSLNDHIRNNRKYLGLLELELDLIKSKIDVEKTVSYLNKNRDAIPKHLAYIRDMKQKEKWKNLYNKVKDGIEKFMKKLTGKAMNEMFYPLKSTSQLICKHCGRIIPIGTYYDTYRNKDYHIECLWDHLINKMPENSYSESEKFFFSLEQYIGDWPAYDFDVEEDYLSDLELVKHNNRILKREPFTDYVKMVNEMFDYYENL